MRKEVFARWHSIQGRHRLSGDRTHLPLHSIPDPRPGSCGCANLTQRPLSPSPGSVGGGREGPLAWSAPLEFEPGRVASIGGVTPRRLIMEAYRLTQYQVSGGPSWLDSDSFALEAKASDTSANENQLRLMLRTLLAERFKLAVSHASREMPVYARFGGEEWTRNSTKLRKARKPQRPRKNWSLWACFPHHALENDRLEAWLPGKP